MATHNKRTDVLANNDAIMEQETSSEIDDSNNSIIVAQGVVSDQEAEIQEIKSQGRSANRQLSNMNVRLNGLDTHLDRISTRLNSTDTRLNRLDGHLSRVDARLHSVNTRLQSLEQRFEGLEKKMDLILELLTDRGRTE
jgi:chromosome segregation ATPase